MMPAADAPHYLCVFRADENKNDDVLDLGQDPDFRPPTWESAGPISATLFDLAAT